MRPHPYPAVMCCIRAGRPIQSGVDDHIVPKVDGHVGDGAARRVEDEVAALALGEWHVLEARIGVELLRGAVGGPGVLNDVDGLRVQARGVEGLEDQAEQSNPRSYGPAPPHV